MPNYRIRWKVKGGATYINNGTTNGIYLPGNAVTITDITGASSGTTVTVTTGTTDHQFAVGQGIVLSGVLPAGLNGLVEVASVGKSGNNHFFTYTVATSPGLTYSSGGTATPTQGIEKTISSISGNGTTVTVNTSLAHGYKVGEPVRITGVSVAGYNQSTTVASVPSSTSFTFSDTTSTSGATGGTVISQGVFTIRTANSTTTISAGTSYDIEVTYDNGGSYAWSGSAVTATPMLAVDMSASSYTTTNVTGTNTTATASGAGSVQRVAFQSAGSTVLYGIMVDMTNNWNSYDEARCTVTYLGKSYTMSAAKGAGGKCYFPVPLSASLVVTAWKNAKQLAGEISLARIIVV